MLCFKPRVPWAGQALKLKGGAHFKLAVQPAPYFSAQHIVDLAHSLASTEGAKGAYQFMTLPTAEASQLSSTRLESHGPAGKAAARMLFGTGRCQAVWDGKRCTITSSCCWRAGVCNTCYRKLKRHSTKAKGKGANLGHYFKAKK